MCRLRLADLIRADRGEVTKPILLLSGNEGFEGTVDVSFTVQCQGIVVLWRRIARAGDQTRRLQGIVFRRGAARRPPSRAALERARGLRICTSRTSQVLASGLTAKLPYATKIAWSPTRPYSIWAGSSSLVAATVRMARPWHSVDERD